MSGKIDEDVVASLDLPNELVESGCECRVAADVRILEPCCVEMQRGSAPAGGVRAPS